MKRCFVIAALASIVAAAPQNSDPPKAAPAAKGDVNEMLEGSCKDIFFIMARATLEPGNLGMTFGPTICNALKKTYPNRVGCQGVGGGYTAALMDNMKPNGTSPAAIEEGIKMFTTANTKCPQAVLTFGGYSQGAAVMHNSVSALPDAVKAKVIGGVLFGDTRNKQDGGQIRNYPKDQVMILCDKDDGVCDGTLRVTVGHIVYLMNNDVEKAIQFLKTKINDALSRSSPRRFASNVMV